MASSNSGLGLADGGLGGGLGLGDPSGNEGLDGVGVGDDLGQHLLGRAVLLEELLGLGRDGVEGGLQVALQLVQLVLRVDAALGVDDALDGGLGGIHHAGWVAWRSS